MKGLVNLPNYSLWSQEFESDEVAKLLKSLFDIFEKDIQTLLNVLNKLRQLYDGNTDKKHAKN